MMIVKDGQNMDIASSTMIYALLTSCSTIVEKPAVCVPKVYL